MLPSPSPMRILDASGPPNSASRAILSGATVTTWNANVEVAATQLRLPLWMPASNICLGENARRALRCLAVLLRTCFVSR